MINSNIIQYDNSIDIFNIIRTIAFLAVFVVHCFITINSLTGIRCPSCYCAWGAMWVFYIISGYLIGKGFVFRKYKTDLGGIINFYFLRLFRIVPPYLFFLLIYFLFINTKLFIEDSNILLKLLTFTFNGNTSAVGIGATWFISTIVQFYLLAPLIYKFLISKIKNNHLYIVIMLLLFGVILRYILNKLNIDHFIIMNTSLYNLDMFFGGMLLNYLPKLKEKRILKFLSMLFFLFIFFLSAIDIISIIYLCPLIFFISTSFLICSYPEKSSLLTLQNLKQKPYRILEFFGLISFNFYLYHSNLLDIFSKVLINYINSPKYLLITTIIIAFVFTSIFSTIIYLTIENPINKYRKNMMIRL